MSLRVAGLCFPFQGKRKTTLSIELKIELRASQGCGLEGGRCSFLEQRSSFRPGPVAGVEGREAVLAQGCQHQLT